MQLKLRSLIIVLVLFIINCLNANAQVTLPPGFNQVFVAGGIISPITMTIIPDGRFFVAQQNGMLRVVKNGVLLPQPFISLNVNTSGERGLLGVAVDSAFATDQYVYLCYTLANGAFNRVSRFTASGDTVIPGSEVILLDLDSLIAVDHGGGHLEFGPDGKLYICAGENMRPTEAQNLNSYLGKIIRINPDGSVPSDNPFPGPGKSQRIWDYGVRNPFTFSFQPHTGRMFINDVGNATWEEINDGTIGGGNFGWPQCEGFCNDTTTQQPFYVYHHGTADSMGCAITGGAFFNPDTTNYPSIYNNKYFYIDYCGNWINMISLTNPPVYTHFASNIPLYSVCMRLGLDGNLYFISRNDQAIYKITYNPGLVPLILSQPLSQSISLGSPVTFSVNASGAMPISYQWRMDTVPIPGATNSSYTIPSVAYTDSGNYNVIVENAYDTIFSNNAYLTIVGNQPPVAVIDTPLTNTFYTAGDTIHFFGSATDPEEGVLQDSAFAWLVEFHHNTHIHPGPMVNPGIHTGYFVIPSIGEPSANVYYRLILIVHDSTGAVDSAYVDVHPRTSTLIFNTQPQGLLLTLDGQPFTAPDTVLAVEGMIRLFGARNSQMMGQTNMLFTSWSNGGTQQQQFTVPVNDTAWTAYYDSAQLAYSLGTDTIFCTGDTFNLNAGSNYSTFAWNDGSVNHQYMMIHSAIPDTITVGVTVTDSTGAAGNDSINVIFTICSSVETIQKELVKIFPVPSGGEITISELQENYLLNVFDMTGRVVISNELVKAERSKRINLQPGIYTFLLLSTDDRVLCRKNVAVIK